MRIYESFMDDNIEDSQVDVQSAGDEFTDDYKFNEEFAWTFSSFNPAVTQSIYDYLHGRVEYLLDSRAKSFSLGMFSSNDETMTGAVFTVGRLDFMDYAVVLMYTPKNRKSVKLPVLIGATLYNAIRNCQYINGDFDDDHYSLWQEQMGAYRLLSDDNFILECCLDVLRGHSTSIDLLCRTFSSTVVNLGYEDLKNELFKLKDRNN